MAPNSSSTIAEVRELIRGGALDLAESNLKSLLYEEPENQPGRILLAVLLFRTGRLDEAAPILEGVCAEDPAQIDATRLLATIRHSKREFERAAPLFVNLIQKGVDGPDIQNQLGACYLELGNTAAAGAAFKRAISLNRSDGRSYYNLGLALKSAGRSFETFLTFKRSLELDPSRLEAYLELWQQMRLLLNWTDGLPLLEQGSKRFPESPQMMLALASTYGKVGRRQEAERIYEAAILRDSSAFYAYAHWLQEEGRFEESVPILQKSIPVESSSGPSLLQPRYRKSF